MTPRLSYYAKKSSHVDRLLYHYDCSRDNAYTRTFSRDKSKQVFQAITILEEFFEDKGLEYQRALIQGKLKFMLGEMSASSIAGDIEYYKTISRLVDKIDREIIQKLGVIDTIIYCVRYPWVIKLMMILGVRIKGLLNQLF